MVSFSQTIDVKIYQILYSHFAWSYYSKGFSLNFLLSVKMTKIQLFWFDWHPRFCPDIIEKNNLFCVTHTHTKQSERDTKRQRETHTHTHFLSLFLLHIHTHTHTHTHTRTESACECVYIKERGIVAGHQAKPSLSHPLNLKTLPWSKL